MPKKEGTTKKGDSNQAAAPCWTPNPGTVAARVKAILEGMTTIRPVCPGSTMNDLNLAPETVRHAMNAAFFPPPLHGLPAGSITGATTAGQIVGMITALLAQQHVPGRGQ